MYDDLHTYVKPGSGAFAQKGDTYDRDPDTVSMYDDLHTYVKPGSGAFAQKFKRDSYDKDPDTVSMYDDLHTYGQPGWAKFPKEAPKKEAPKKEAPKKLMQVNRRDTYDRDPDTVSMYDDLHTYVKPGSGAFAQKSDTYDRDPDTVSMYDDLHTYVKPGSGAFAQKPKRDTFDKDPDTVSMYDDLHTYGERGGATARKSLAQKRDVFDNDPNSASVYDAGFNIPYQRVENKRKNETLAQIPTHFDINEFNQEAIQSESELNMFAQNWVQAKATKV